MMTKDHMNKELDAGQHPAQASEGQMKLALDKASYAAWRRGDISLRSLVLHSVGCTLIGTPAALDMPPDFYYISGDRNVPHPNDYDWDQQRALLYVDTFRRELTNRVAKWCLALSAALFVACLLLQGVASGVSTLYNKAGDAFSSATRKSPDTMSRDEASERLRELKAEFAEMERQPAPDIERLRTIQEEAQTLLRRYPDLQHIVR